MRIILRAGAWRVRVVCVFSLLLLLQACGSSGGGGGAAPDTTAPTASVSPATLPLGDSQDVVIQFSETMDPASLVLGGSLAGVAYTETWSQTSSADDTVTLSPASSWPGGSSITLTVDAADDATTPNAMATLNLQFDVYPGTIYYVSSAAVDDSGDGLSIATAKQTIRAAIEQSVTDTNNPATVVVNAGNYTVNSDPGGTQTHVVLVEGVSLYGGYAADFSERDATIYISQVTDTSAQASGTARVLEFNSGVTGAVVVDGFTLNGSSQAGNAYSSAVHAQFGSAAIIRNNIINGGSGSFWSHGVYVSGADPVIDQNREINGGNGGNTSRGIYSVSGANPLVTNNTLIDGGHGVSFSYGVQVGTGGAASVQGNTSIVGGDTALNVYGVHLNTTEAVLVDNNGINGGSGTSLATGISMENTGTYTVSQNTIAAGTAESGTYGLYLNSTGVISVTGNSMIDGGTASAGTSQGIEIRSNPSLLVSGNVIFGGSGDSTSYGIVDSSSSSAILIANNMINAGHNSGMSLFGIATYGSADLSIRNNTIYASGTSVAAGIGVGGSAAPMIDNNIILTESAGSGSCINEYTAGANATTIRNNALRGCAVPFYDEDNGCADGDSDGNARTCTIADMEALHVNYSGNIDVDAGLANPEGPDMNINTMADNDWHLTAASPASITAGGLNGEDSGGWGFTDDFDGVNRPGTGNPWSIGADEYVAP